MTTTNELLSDLYGFEEWPDGAKDRVDAALAAEYERGAADQYRLQGPGIRRATVERMVAVFGLPGTADTIEDVHRILDAESEKGA